MILIEDKIIDLNKFPDGTFVIKEDIGFDFKDKDELTINWFYEKEEEFVALIFLTKHIKAHGINDIVLNMPYIPNARQDRVKHDEDVFTLKYFAEIINYLGFKKVYALDAHSSTSEDLIENIEVLSPKQYILKAIGEIGDENLLIFYPDKGAMERYSGMINRPYCYGVKNRQWETGEIKSLDVTCEIDLIENSNVLIIDDIVSRGGTSHHSGLRLKELGAKDIYLYISHCENTILKGDILKDDTFKKVYTTNSIFTGSHEKIGVFDLESVN